jgi:hypothetical protein
MIADGHPPPRARPAASPRLTSQGLSRAVRLNMVVLPAGDPTSTFYPNCPHPWGPYSCG